VIAREMRAGRDLYTDLWDNKPPVLYLAYAAAQAVAGDGEGSLFLLGAAASLAVLGGLYAAGRRAGSPAAGLAAAAFWAVVSADLLLQANEPNIELLVNAALCAAFAALVAPGARPLSPAAVVAGLALGAATLLKPVILPVAGVLLAAHVLAPPPGVPRRRSLVQATAVFALVALAWAGVALYFWADGRIRPYWETVFVYNEYYAGDPWKNLREGLSPDRLVAPVLRNLAPLAVAALFGAAAGLGRRPSRAVVLVAAWLCAVPAVVAAPGKFFAHYYQYWLPPLCLAAAWGTVTLAARIGRAPRVLGPALAAAVLVALAVLQAPSYALGADQWSRAKYGDIFLRARDAAREVDAELEPGETFYHFGNEPELYFYTGRRPPAGVMWAQHLQYGPLRNGLRVRVLAQLQLDEPELVVLTREVGDPPGALGRWLAERYEQHPLRHRREGFWFWVKKGGKLQRRLIASRGSRSPL
jgi:hypothetical protein